MMSALLLVAALHAGFQVHLLDPAGATIVRTDSYAPLLPFNAQRADWAGRSAASAAR